MFLFNGPIIMATDLSAGSSEALRQAFSIARFGDKRLTVCFVLPESFAYRSILPEMHRSDEVQFLEMEERASVAVQKQVADVCPEAQEIVDVVIESGPSPHSTLIHLADTRHAGLIVLWAGGAVDGPQGLGSVVENVVRHAHCPVLLVRPGLDGPVLAATDFSDPSMPAVAAGAAEAKRRGVPLAVVHAVEFALPFVPMTVYWEAPPTVQAYEPQIRKALTDRLQSTAYEYGATEKTLLVDGPAAKAIIGATESQKSQLVVLGTHGRSGLERMLLGSVVEAVVRDAACYVLVVRFARYFAEARRGRSDTRGG